MEEKAPQKLGAGELHDLLLARAVIAIGETNAIMLEGKDPFVTDRNAMGVRGEIREHLPGTAEGSFAVDNPILLAAACEKEIEGSAVGKSWGKSREFLLFPRLA